MKVQLPEIKLMGMSTKTNNRLEASIHTSGVHKLFMDYFVKGACQQVKNKISQGKLYVVYTEYESEMHGDYTCFIGDEVSDFEDAPGLTNFTIPSQTYLEYVNGPGEPAKLAAESWMKIWGAQLPRTYKADFDLYDLTAKDPKKVTVRTYVAVE